MIGVRAVGNALLPWPTKNVTVKLKVNLIKRAKINHNYVFTLLQAKTFNFFKDGFPVAIWSVTLSEFLKPFKP